MASPTWYVAQNVGSLLAMTSHALRFAGASPNHCATCACTAGVVIQFIHRYMQLGCAACEYIIQVSDHPVDPSLGTVTATGVGVLSVSRRFAITWQVVPMTESALANADCSLV